MVRSSSGVSSSEDSGTPSFRQSAAVRSEVGTPITFSPPSTRSASSRTNSSAVEPVPMPSRMPLLDMAKRRARGLDLEGGCVHCGD